MKTRRMFGLSKKMLCMVLVFTLLSAIFTQHVLASERGLIIDPPGEQANQTVNIPDPNLQAAVRELLEKPTGDITREDMTMIMSLNAPDENITSIEGLQYCTNMVCLMIQNNNISDFSPLSSLTKLTVLYLSGNATSDYSPVATYYSNLVARDFQYSVAPTPTGEVRVDFTTTGDSTNMRCDFDQAATAVWHWTDGTTTAAVSGDSITKSGLGQGSHQNYLTVSNAASLTRFGAGSSGYGHIVSISGLQNCPNMAILYAYQESALTSISDTSTTAIREYHLMSTSLTAAGLDAIFADAAASGVQNGILWADNSGTSESNSDKATLQTRGWTLSIPAWPSQTSTPVPTAATETPTQTATTETTATATATPTQIVTGGVRIDFITNGDSTNMRCDFGQAATAVWHWADGSTTAAVSGESVTKSGLGEGMHFNYLTVSNGPALTRFGAGNAGYGHIVLISGLQNCPNMAILYTFLESSLTSIGNTSSTAIREYHIAGTGLNPAELDGIFADAAASGVQNGVLWANYSGTSVSDAAKTTLQNRGWTLYIPSWTPQASASTTPQSTPTAAPTPTTSTEEARIDFTTSGDSTNMRCDFVAPATAVWHWADGTTTAAVSGESITKSGLGDGEHQNYLTVSNASALTRFGAGNAGYGHIVSISGLQNCPGMAILYAYMESSLTSIGDTSTTEIREYHLAGTGLGAAVLDEVFADAEASGVLNGTLWANYSGTSASDSAKTTLQNRGWSLEIPSWTPQPTQTASPTPTPTTPPITEGAINFITEGSTFSPVIQVTGNAQITWTFADGTTSSSNVPVKDYGSAGTRAATLVVTPWSAVTRINIGYDAGDGGSGSIEFVPDQHVSAVYNLNLVAPYLRQWCSSYNQITSLDFSNFIQLDTIECFLSGSLQTVNLSNTPELKRICFEDCNLLALDLSQCPDLEDLRGASNQYSTIEFGSVGANAWHICIRDNAQFTDQSMFQDMSQFPDISELFIWNDNQAGTISIPSSSTDRGISFSAAGNHYTNLNLQGALQVSSGTASVDFSNNLLTNVNLTGCTQINNLNLQNNQLGQSEVDEILAALDSLGRSTGNTPGWVGLSVDISGGGNQQPSQAGYASALSLAGKGWTVVATGWSMLPSAPSETGEASIDFNTTGDSTNMRCDFSTSATAVWHWSDGTTTDAVSGAAVTKSGLGAGTHQNYLTISNGSALTRFGAGNAGQGNLVTISGLNNCSGLNIVYAYQEGSLTSIGNTSTSSVDEYHLMSTQLSAAEMDMIFAYAVASGVQNGIIYGNNSGTSASDANKATLQARGWSIY